MTRLITAEVDRVFLDSVKDTFLSANFDDVILPLLLGTFLVAGGIVVVGAIVNKVLSSLRRQSLPPGWIGRKADLIEIFTLAHAQRSRFELGFHTKGRKRRTAYCSLHSVGRNSLIFELDRGRAGQSWVGREFDAFFRVVRKNKKVVFFAFSSELVGLKKITKDTVHLTVRFPACIELRQKRQHFRLDPPPHLILGIALWPELRSGGGLLRHVREWGRPQFAYYPERQNPFSLINISAGGIRLSVSRPVDVNFPVEIKYGNRVMLMLELYEPVTGTKERFAANCLIKNIFDDFSRSQVELGLEFIEYGLADREDPFLFTWRVAGNEGVPEIGNWTMRRHLELVREKGLA